MKPKNQLTIKAKARKDVWRSDWLKVSHLPTVPIRTTKMLRTVTTRSYLSKSSKDFMKVFWCGPSLISLDTTGSYLDCARL